MRLDPWTLAAILGMTLATCFSRWGGYWLFRRMPPRPAVRAVLAYIPGTIFVAFVVPSLVDGGPQQWLGAVATLAVMAATGSMSGAILAGTAAAWAVWSLH